MTDRSVERLQDTPIDESCEEYQRLIWEDLEKSIDCLVNRVNVNNLPMIVGDLVKLNLIRGAGILCQSVLTAQSTDPSLTNVYAALVSIVNSKLPQIGKILINRLIDRLRKSYVQNDKETCIIVAQFIAHLFNQDVVNELLVLEILTFLIENPTSDCVEIAVSLLKACGAKLKQLCPKGFIIIFDMLRKIKNKLNTRAQCEINVIMSIRKGGYKDHPIVVPELDLLKEKEKITHLLELEDELEMKDELNMFQFDADYLENEKKYSLMRKILKDSIGSISLQRRLYLNLQSSLQPEEAAKRLIQFQLGDRIEICLVIIDCCVQQITYNKSHEIIAQNLCSLSPEYVATFSSVFVDCLTRIDHFQGQNKLRNVARFTAHLLITESIPWTVFSSIQLNEHETSSTSKAFIKNLFQELSYSMGIKKLKSIVEDSTLREAFAGIFHRNSTKATNFLTDFFTEIGLSSLVENLKLLPANESTVVSKGTIEIDESASIIGQ